MEDAVFAEWQKNQSLRKNLLIISNDAQKAAQDIVILVKENIARNTKTANLQF